MKTEWNLSKLPPFSHEDVADFAFNLFDIARAEKERLKKPDDFYRDYALYRGKKDQPQSARKGYVQDKTNRIPINLYFSNVERTVASITARNPTGEVVDIDGVNDGAEQIISQRLAKWWQDTSQQHRIRQSARQMEIYGITVEKPYWDSARNQPNTIQTDPFAFFPAPGYWENISEEAPYIAYAYLDYVSSMEAQFKVTGIASEDSYDLLGTKREDFKPQGYGPDATIGNYATAVTTGGNEKQTDEKPLERCLVIELWIRDDADEMVSEPITMEIGGEQVLVEQKVQKKRCPDGIRKITIAKSKNANPGRSGYMVLSDTPNPNINPKLPVDMAANTYPWGRLPVYTANSYRDEISVWGFSASEQVADLMHKINAIFNKLFAYVINVMAPPLILQNNCGITKEMIENSMQKAGRLILMPTTPNARIEFMQIPSLPSTFFQVLDLMIMFFDRVYQIEDADRGKAPSRIVAASAIVALQERNQLVMQPKSSAIDSMVEQKSRWAIGLWQNFGIMEETVNVAGDIKRFVGYEFANRKFSYVIESGSTTPKTSLQREEQAMKLYQLKAIGQQGLLKAINWPDWKEEIERTAETQLDQALMILIQAGLPQETASELRAVLMQPQGGPGDETQTPPTEAQGE